MADAKYNLRNPAVKRILQEMREMAQDDALDFVAQAFEENIFEWHFVIRGPPDTDFEGGLYHGRILLPSEFETHTKICLSISDYHPEHWQPSWSVRTALTALVAFLPTPGKGAVGSTDLPSDVRKQLALQSQTEIVEVGTEERRRLARELHEKLQNRIKTANKVPLPKPELVGPSSSGRTLEGPSGNSGPEVVPPAATRSEWLWTSLSYVLGFLILAIVTKKMLVKAGYADFTSTD